MTSLKSKSKKYLFLIAGTLSLGIGIIGIFLPLIPTTPMLLMTAFFYLKSSKRLYNFVINNKLTGYYIKSYIEKRGIPLKLKIFNIALLWVFIGYSIFFIIEALYIKLLLFLIAIGVSLHIILIKTLKKNE